MTNSNRMNEKRIRIIMIALLTLLGIYSYSAQAQSTKSIKYIGFQVSFGERLFQVSSNLKKIDQMQAGHEGGSLGIVFGNNQLKTRVSFAGVFYSNSNTPHTQQLFETAVMTNLYPLAVLTKYENATLQPYLTAGFSMNKTNFFGTYLDNQNIKSGDEPYLGKVSQVMAQGGVGLEYRLISRVDFIHLFAEAMVGSPIQSNASDTFSETALKQFTSINVGICFGRRR